MSGRLRRFLLLERPRADRGGAPDAPGASAARVKGVERAGPSPREGVAQGHLDRFRPAPERSLELDLRGDESQPFVRCMRCETDHGRGAAVCSTCGADLDSPEQRDFNERLWQARRSERKEEAAAAARREAERRVESEAVLRARRQLGETLAREVGDLERRRIEADAARDALGGALGGGSGGTRPLLFRILGALPDWRWQVGAILAAVGAVAALVAFGRAGHPFALVLAAVVAVLLLVPPLRSRDWF